MAVQTIISSYSDGPTLSAASAGSALPTYCVTTLPAGYWQIGRIWRITASGRISIANPSPGTARFDLRMSAVTAADTLAITLNALALKTNVPWWLEMLITCRTVGSGTAATLMNQGVFFSEAVNNTAAVATGPGPGGATLPYATAPVVGSGFDSTIANPIDFRFTQTVVTGSMTMHQIVIEQLTP